MAEHKSPTWSDDPLAYTEDALDPADPAFGPVDERYTELGEIGAGGMGRVVLVRDREMRREVALKEISASAATNTRAVQRFLREARVTAQLEHPGVIPVYELGRRPDGTPFYTMKRIRGRTLREAYTSATTLRRRLDLFDHFVDLCQTVAYAHSRGVCHRDLKPENVMIGAFGETVVMDWGLVRIGGVDTDAPDGDVPLIDSGETLATGHGVVFGTPEYMSPEQVRGQPAGPASDVWSLGVMLHELLYGAAPFEATTRDGIFTRVLVGWIPPKGGAAPPELVAVLRRALASDATDRYPDAGALVEDLDAWRKGQRVGAYTYSTVQVVLRWVRRHRFAVGTAVTAAAVVLVVAALAFREVARERDVAQHALGRATSEALLAKAREAVLLRRPDHAVGYLLGGLELSADRGPFVSELAAAHALLPPSVVLAGAAERLVGAWAAGDGQALYAVAPTGEVVRWADGKRATVAKINGQVVGVEAQEGQDLAVIYARPERGGALHAHVFRGDPLTLVGSLVFRADTLKSSQFSPSGRMLAVEGNTGALELWDLTTLRLLSTQPADEYVRYTFVGDDRLATCSPMRPNEDGLALHSVATGELLARLGTLGGRCRRVYAAGTGLVAESYGMDRYYWADPAAPPTWRADIGKSEEAWSDVARDLLITDWRDGKLTVHRLSTGALFWETQRDHRDASFRFSSQGVPRLVTFDADRISVLDAATGALLGVLPTQTASASRVVFLSGGRLATLAPTGELRLWSSVAEGTPRILHAREGAQVVSLAESGGLLRLAHIFGIVAVPWPAGGEPIPLATMPDKVPCAIEPGADGTLDVLWSNRCRAGELDMGFGSGAGMTLAHHSADGAVLASVTRPEALGGSAGVEGLGGGRAASVGDGDCVATLAVDTAAPRSFCTPGRRYLAAALAPDGRVLAGGHAVGVTLWDTATGATLAELGAGSAVGRLAWSPRGGHLAVAAGGRLYTVDARAGAWVIEERATPAPIVAPVTWSADGAWIVTGTQAGPVAVFSASAGAEHPRRTRASRLLDTGSSDRAWAFAFSSDGRWLGVGREGGRVEVFDLATDGLLLSVLLDTRLVLALGWASDGGTLFVGGEERVYALPVRGPDALLAHAASLTNLRLCADTLELVAVDPGESSSVAPPELCRGR